MGLKKTAIIGTGHVGAHCAYTLAVQGICDEIILLDCNRQKLSSEAFDLADSVSCFPHHTTIRQGDYEDLSGCDVAVLSVGTILPGSRLQELPLSLELVSEIVPKAVNAGFNGIFVVITNPCDIIAYSVWKLSGFDSSRVFATGTTLDSARLQHILSAEIGIAPQSISAYTLGEHGDSQMIPWSAIQVAGIPLFQIKPLDDHNRLRIWNHVVNRAGTIVKGKGATEYGIASGLSRILKSIYRDEKAVFPVSVLLQGQYGQEGVFLSTPCIIGKAGIEGVLELPMTKDEKKEYAQSADSIRKLIHYHYAGSAVQYSEKSDRIY